MRTILIYNGEGVADRSRVDTPQSIAALVDSARYTVRPVSATEIRAGSWRAQAALLVMPGGRDLPYGAALNGDGNRHIREFVSSGGSYLGFCAGAYYGAARIEFDKDYPLEVCGDRELRFFPGLARGPAFGPGSYQYNSESGARAARLSWCADPAGIAPPLTIYYNGGCTFESADRERSVAVLARYQDLPHAPAAIVHSSIGSGQVVLCAVHPEYRPESLSPQTDEVAKLRAELECNETGRVWLLQAILKRLGVI